MDEYDAGKVIDDVIALGEARDQAVAGSSLSGAHLFMALVVGAVATGMLVYALRQHKRLIIVFAIMLSLIPPLIPNVIYSWLMAALIFGSCVIVQKKLG